jgi:hypothetical protein
VFPITSLWLGFAPWSSKTVTKGRVRIFNIWRVK